MLGNDAIAEGKPSSSKTAEGDASIISMVCVEDQTGLYIRAWINGVKFPRRLIDTGVEINLIFIKDAIKLGFSYNMGGIQRIKGFNGGVCTVNGVMECDICLGPCGEPKKVGFLVTSVATIPIIGCPTLVKLDIWMDC